MSATSNGSSKDSHLLLLRYLRSRTVLQYLRGVAALLTGLALLLTAVTGLLVALNN
jgi:hypothetical protein